MRYLFFLLIVSHFSYSQTKLSFLNKPFNDPEINAPGRGAEFWNGTQWDNINAPQIPNGTTLGSNGYNRFNWFDLEGPTQGSYKLTGPFPSLEFMIRQMIDRGHNYSFSLMTVCEGCDMPWPNGERAAYPYYLHELMQSEPENSRDWYCPYGYWVPNWNSAYYLDRFDALLDTIARFIANGSYVAIRGPYAGKKVAYKNVINYIDIGGYGNYGEWHSYPYQKIIPEGRAATAATFKRIIDAHIKAFPNYPLVALESVFNANESAFVPNEIGYYVLTTSNAYGKIGWRRNNLGEPLEDNRLSKNTGSYLGMRFDTAIVNRYKYAIVTGEPIRGGSQYAPNNKPYSDLRREINLYHISGFGNGNYPLADIAKTSVRDTLHEAFKITGYRFNINGGSISTNLYTNTPFNITLRWRNVGVAPLYQKRWQVKYQLRTSTDQILQEWNSYFNPYLFLPSSSDSVVSQNFVIGNIPAGSNYKLVMFIQDTTGYHSPLPLALKSPGRNPDGSYTLRSKLTVANGTAPAQNSMELWLGKENPKGKGRTKAQSAARQNYAEEGFWNFDWLVKHFR